MFPNQLFPPQLFSPHIFSRPIRSASLLDTLFFTQNYNTSQTANNTDALVFTQTLSVQVILQYAITDTLTFTDSVILAFPIYQPRITDILTFTQIVTTSFGIQTSIIVQNLNFTQTLSYIEDSFIFGGPFSDRIFAEQIFPHWIFPRTYLVLGVNVYPVEFTHRLNFTDISSSFKPTLYERSLTDTLNLIDYPQTLLRSDVFHLRDHLFFDQNVTFEFPPTVRETLEDELIFTDLFTQQLILNIHIIDYLIFNETSIRRIIEGIPIDFPLVLVTKSNRAKSKVLLRTDTDTIILPAPLFSDTLNNVGTVNINRTVSGKIYTTIKSTSRQRLHWRFEIRRQKSNELQRFIDNNILKWIWIEDFNGAMWYSKIANNLINYSAISRDGICDNNKERHEVEIEFEGFLVTNQLDAC